MYTVSSLIWTHKHTTHTVPTLFNLPSSFRKEGQVSPQAKGQTSQQTGQRSGACCASGISRLECLLWCLWTPILWKRMMEKSVSKHNITFFVVKYYTSSKVKLNTCHRENLIFVGSAWPTYPTCALFVPGSLKPDYNRTIVFLHSC